MSNYYNEIDPFAAAMLRNLIAAGHIAPGIVDERSIEDVRPDELVGYTQCHFFAGVGVWSLALRAAGWPDDRPVWTGSCPCQPFSAAGKGDGFADERHLWPAFHHLIAQCRPAIVFGEQVASKAVEPWIDLVHADMEAVDYAFGCVPFPSAGVGAPHIRDRAYWVADTGGQRWGAWRYANTGNVRHQLDAAGHRRAVGLADAGFCGDRCQGRTADHGQQEADGPSNWTGRCGCASCRLADADDSGRQRWRSGEACNGGDTPRLELERLHNAGRVADASAAGQPIVGRRGSVSAGDARPHVDEHHDAPAAGPTNGLWGAADWLLCRDGKWRPVEPGTFPLAHGAPARVGRLRAYGNAINAKAAQAFIESVM